MTLQLQDCDDGIIKVADVGERLRGKRLREMSDPWCDAELVAFLVALWLLSLYQGCASARRCESCWSSKVRCHDSERLMDWIPRFAWTERRSNKCCHPLPLRLLNQRGSLSQAAMTGLYSYMVLSVDDQGQNMFLMRHTNVDNKLDLQTCSSEVASGWSETKWHKALRAHAVKVIDTAQSLWWRPWSRVSCVMIREGAYGPRALRGACALGELDSISYLDSLLDSQSAGCDMDALPVKPSAWCAHVDNIRALAVHTTGLSSV